MAKTSTEKTAAAQPEYPLTKMAIVAPIVAVVLFVGLVFIAARKLRRKWRQSPALPAKAAV